jgi:stage V sporulation protein D (sporulation-specific penicillin-binding protein)
MRGRWDSDRTTGIVMDPKTGKIVAMAVSPHFDINNFRDEKDISVFNNLNVEGVFEMGSIVKPLIAAIALDQQVITADTRYNDSGSVQVRNRTIRNFDRKGRGNGVTMQQVLNESLNTGMVFIMQQMKPNLFVEQFSKFRFDQKTGIDLPGEIGGITSNLQTARDVELANISFGQGIAVTPIGMIRAFSALANRGQLVEPHVVDSIEYLDESIKTIEPKIIDIVISPATSEEITRMLVNVFDNYFSGTKKIPHYSVAGKTGTAQIANSETGGYYDDRNLHTFVGYFPAYDPQFIIFMMNEHPKQGARFSSQTLIDPFLNLTKFLINYYNIPPDR